jgi:hypothetical protein
MMIMMLVVVVMMMMMMMVKIIIIMTIINTIQSCHTTPWLIKVSAAQLSSPMLKNTLLLKGISI